MREKKDHRIFFALWPDDALRRRLFDTAKTMQIKPPGRFVPDYNLHLTLHFIGNVYRDELACLRAQAHKAEGRRFELEVDSHGFFARPRVAWLGCSRLPDRLIQLHHDLGGLLMDCGFVPEKRRYNPHLTVVRKNSRKPLMTTFKPISWAVDNFVLIESRAIDNGVKYEVLETYPLA